MTPNPLDTQLARLLHSRGRIPLAALTQHLDAVRASRAQQPNASLAGSLVGGGLLSEPEATAYVQELKAWLEASSSSVDARSALNGSAQVGDTQAPGSDDGLAWSGEGAGWRPGAQIGPYLLGQKIGEGGMGVVFKAQQVETGEIHAIKGLSMEAEEILLQRFEREVIAQSKVDRHPNVVRVHAAGESMGYRYLAMDLASGGDLQQRLKRTKFTHTESARLVLDLARGLAHVHACGILHRDLKPANVLFDAEGSAKLVDFGLAGLRSGGSSLTRTGDMLGTPSYMAPEQALGDFSRVDARADVYALGAILYECLSGSPPFVASSIMEVLSMVITAPPPPLRDQDASIDRGLEEICLAALAKEPEDRIPSAADLANRLAAWLVDHVEEGPSRGSGRGLLLTATGVALLLGAGALGFAALRPAPTPTPSSTPTPTSTTSLALAPAAGPWKVKTGQKLEAEFYLRSRSLSSLRVSGNPILAGSGGQAIQELNATLLGRVESVAGGVARIQFDVKTAASRARRMGTQTDVKFNYLKDWPGCKFTVDFDAQTGAPKRVFDNNLPTKVLDLSQRGTLYAELASERSLLRLFDGAFHYFPRAEVAPGKTWVLESEPLEAVMQVVRQQIPGAARHIAQGMIVVFAGGERQIKLSRAERTVRVAEDGRLRWGPGGDAELPKPERPGREARGVAILEAGWIKTSVAEESFFLEYPEKPGGIPQLKVEMHVQRGVRVTLIEDEAASGE